MANFIKMPLQGVENGYVVINATDCYRVEADGATIHLYYEKMTNSQGLLAGRTTINLYANTTGKPADPADGERMENLILENLGVPGRVPPFRILGVGQLAEDGEVKTGTGTQFQGVVYKQVAPPTNAG